MNYRLPLVALQIATEMQEHVQRLSELYREATDLLSQARRDELDNHTKFLDQYHKLETAGPFNACEGWMIAKAMQDTLVARRQAKWDADSLEKLMKRCDEMEMWRTLARFGPGLSKMRDYLEARNASHEEYLRLGPNGEMEEVG